MFLVFLSSWCIDPLDCDFVADHRIHAVADDNVEFVRESRISFDVD